MDECTYFFGILFGRQQVSSICNGAKILFAFAAALFHKESVVMLSMQTRGAREPKKQTAR